MLEIRKYLFSIDEKQRELILSLSQKFLAEIRENEELTVNDKVILSEIVHKGTQHNFADGNLNMIHDLGIMMKRSGINIKGNMPF